MTATVPTFSTSRVAALCNVSLRQLQHWDECGTVTPRINGHSREYSRQEALEAAIVAVLRRKGMSLQSLRLLMPAIRRDIGTYLRGVRSTEMYLLTDGIRAVHFERDIAQVLAILKAARRGMYLVCVSDLARKLNGATP